RRLRAYRGPMWRADDLLDAVEALLEVVTQAGENEVEFVESGTTELSQAEAVDRLLRMEAEEREADDRDERAMLEMQLHHEAELDRALEQDRRAWDQHASRQAQEWDDWAMFDEMSKGRPQARVRPQLYMTVATSHLQNQAGTSRTWRFPLAKPGQEPVRVSFTVEEVMEPDPEDVETVLVASPSSKPT
ncbi:unnamed protein product, partial [Symbiodinium necroappetens]